LVNNLTEARKPAGRSRYRRRRPIPAG